MNTVLPHSKKILKTKLERIRLFPVKSAGSPNKVQEYLHECPDPPKNPVPTKVTFIIYRTNQKLPGMKVTVWKCSSLSCDPNDYSLPGFSVYGNFQARILEWVAIPFSRGSFQTRDQTWVSCTAGRFFTIWASGPPTYHNVICQLYLNKKITRHKSKQQKQLL